MERRRIALAALAGLLAAGRADAQYLYGIDNLTDQLIWIDPATGVGTPVGPLGLDVATAGADFACDGSLWAFAGVYVGESGNEYGNRMVLFAPNLESGLAGEVRYFDIPGLLASAGMEFGPDEQTIYWRNAAGLYTVDPASGTISEVATYAQNGVSLTMPATCDAFLSTDGSSQGTFLVRIDPATGARTVIGPSLSFTSLAATPDGRLFGHQGGRLYRIDPGTGATELVGPIGYSVVGMAFGPAGVCCLPADGDEDGVPDPDDRCPSSAPGAVVDAEGCSIGDLCPCLGASPWRNHGAYVSCVAHVAGSFVGSGLLDEAGRSAAVAGAARSACGKRR